MSDETLHPASEVPGGLWMGAACLESGENDAVVTLVGWGVHDYRVTLADGAFCGADAADIVLVLPGPLGLGLAALAARVAARSRCVPHHVMGLLDPGWAGFWPLAADVAEKTPGLIPPIASCLALTDRLCALVELELEPGEVARWEPWPEGHGWTLMASAGLWFFGPSQGDHNTHHVDTKPLPQDDPIAALRACVAEVDRLIDAELETAGAAS